MSINAGNYSRLPRKRQFPGDISANRGVRPSEPAKMPGACQTLFSVAAKPGRGSSNGEFRMSKEALSPNIS